MKYIIAFILLASTARADVGQSYFACPQFTKQQLAKALTVYRGVKKPAIALLWGTFGNPRACAEAFAKLPGPKFIQVHISNEAGRRNRRLDVGELLKGYSQHRLNRALVQHDRTVIKAINRRARTIHKQFNDVCNRKNVSCAISTGLENNYTKAAAENYIKLLRQAVPTWQIVHNPVGYRLAYVTSADLHELHGVSASFAPAINCIANLDGDSISSGGRRKYEHEISVPEARRFIGANKLCRVVFLWNAGQQGIDLRGFIRPRQRVLRVSTQDLAVTNHLIKEFEK